MKSMLFPSFFCGRKYTELLFKMLFYMYNYKNFKNPINFFLFAVSKKQKVNVAEKYWRMKRLIFYFNCK